MLQWMSTAFSNVCLHQSCLLNTHSNTSVSPLYHWVNGIPWQPCLTMTKLSLNVVTNMATTSSECLLNWPIFKQTKQEHLHAVEATWKIKDNIEQNLSIIMHTFIIQTQDCIWYKIADAIAKHDYIYLYKYHILSVKNYTPPSPINKQNNNTITSK